MKKKAFFGGIKPLDFLMLALSLCIVAFCFLRLKSDSAVGKKTVVVGSPSGEYVFPLEKDGLYDIPGALGVSKIRIREGKAYFEASPCPNKTCIQQGGISKNGEWAACLPNDVFVRIESSEEIDALAF